MGFLFVTNIIFVLAPVVEVLPSRCGGVLIAYDGYVYRKKKQYSTSLYSFWTCSIKECPSGGNLFSDGAFFTSKNGHNHPRDYEKINEMKIMARLKIMAEKTTRRTAEILREIGIDDPTKRYQRYITEVRKRKTRQNKIPESVPEINVGHDYETIPSSKNRPIILKDGNLYLRNGAVKSNKNSNNVYWRCSVTDCPSRGKTTEKDEFIIKVPQHPHDPQSKYLADPEKRLALHNAAMDTSKPLVEIVAEQQVEDVFAKRYLRHLRNLILCNNDNGSESNPASPEIIELDEEEI